MSLLALLGSHCVHVQQHHAACGASRGARRQKRPDEVSRRETRRGKAMRASASSSRSVTPLPPSTMNARNGESVSPHHWTTTCARVVCRVGARTWRERSGERVGHWAKARKSRTRLGRARADRLIRGARRDCSCFRAAILTARRSVLQRGSLPRVQQKRNRSCVKNILAGGTRPVY